jgi:hypothetical protein
VNVRKKKELTRRWELKRIATRLKRLSRQRVPPMRGEEQLRNRVHRDLTREGRSGIDGTLVRAIDEVIDSHVIEMQAEIFRRHKAEEMELGELQARLDGLAVQYREDEHRQKDVIEQLTYQRRAALRRVEDRDTPMPAGSDGVEEDGYQHGNVGDLAGRGLRTRLVLYLVLFLAMVADLITFRQVVERVVNDSAVFPLVLALTVTTTYVAHRAGEAFKTAKEARRNVRRAVSAWTLSATWLAMGIGAFLFRLLAPAPAGANAVENYVSSGAATPGAADGSPVLSAVLLLLLYLLTGAIATTAGFQRPRPEVEQYKRADRKLRTVGPRLAALRRDVAEAEALRRQLTDLRVGRKEQYAVEVGRCKAAAQRVKAEASMLARSLLRSGDRSWLRRMIWDRTVSVDDRLVTDSVDDGPTGELAGRRPANIDQVGQQRLTDSAADDQDSPGEGPSAVPVL